MRGIAALGVIIGHTLYTKLPVINGAFWVWVFFILSGYLQGHSFFESRYPFDKKGFRRFYVNRALRIIPLFWLILISGYLLRSFFGQSIAPFHFFKELLALTSNIETVGPLWSISAEIKFYIAAPILCFFLTKVPTKRNQVLVTLMISFLFTVSAYKFAVFNGDNPAQPRSFLGNSSFFVFGILLSWLKPYLSSKPLAHSLKYGTIIMFILLTTIINNYFEAFFWKLGGILISFAIVTLLLSIKTESSINIFERSLNSLGKYCYGIYVYSSLIAVAYQGYGIKPGWTAFLVQLTSIPMAIISFKIFEKPLLRFKL